MALTGLTGLAGLSLVNTIIEGGGGGESPGWEGPFTIGSISTTDATVSSIVVSITCNEDPDIGDFNFRVQVQLTGGDWSSLIYDYLGDSEPVNSVSVEGANTLEYVINSLIDDTTYDIRIRSEKDGEFGEWAGTTGSTAVIDTWDGPYTITNLEVLSINTTDFHITFTNSDPLPEEYNIRMQLKHFADDWNDLLANVLGEPQEIHSLIHLGDGEFDYGLGALTASTQYSVRVRSEKDGQTGDWEELNVTTSTPGS